jgi:hypothetical protein
MSSYGDYVKKVKASDEARFFGPSVVHRSNKYFTFDHVLSEDEIILVTNNIVTVKGNPVMVVGTHSGVYLKDWTMREVHNHRDGYNAYAVKLKRDFYKVYTFSTPLSEDIDIDGVQTFDDLKAIAASQDGSEIAQGHAGGDY